MAETYRSVGPDVLEEIFTIVEEASQERKRSEGFANCFFCRENISLRIKVSISF